MIGAARFRSLVTIRHIILLGLAIRIVAAVFARGYGMHDDHFGIPETAQAWVEGRNLPSPAEVSIQNGTYVGLHYVLFRGLEAIGVVDPQAKMYVVRALHAVYSVLGVVLAVAIAGRLGGPAAARQAALLMAFFWPLPFLSVRNLTEVVVIPPLMLSVWLLLADRARPRPGLVFVAGLAAGVAFVVRCQTASFLAVLCLLVLIERRWRSLVAFAAGAALVCGLLSGVLDYAMYGVPFGTLVAYVRYNANPATMQAYTVGPWYTYVGTLVGILIPPSSLLILALFGAGWKRASYVVLPAFLFLAFHSAYPNKQERFILPAVPFILIGVAVMWTRLRDDPRTGSRWQTVFRWSWQWFWAVNTCLLMVVSVSYSKRTRVELMTYLREARAPAAVIETAADAPPMMPRFYLGRPCRLYEVSRTRPVERLASDLGTPGAIRPSYIVYLGDEHLEERRARIGELFPAQTLEQIIAPSLVDWLLWRLNPRFNVNQTAYVYRIGQVAHATLAMPGTSIMRP
jgi:hypothetical protein